MRIIGLSMIALASLATIAYGYGQTRPMFFGRKMGMGTGMNYGYGGGYGMVQPVLVAGRNGGGMGMFGQGGIFSTLVFLFVFVILIRTLFNDDHGAKKPTVTHHYHTAAAPVVAHGR